MRDYGKVQSTLWMHERLSALGKTIVAYLHSGPHANWIGCYYCPIGYVAADLELSVNRVRKAFDELLDHQIIKVNGRMIFLPGFIKSNPAENANITISRIKEFTALADGEHKAWVAAEILEHMGHLTDEQRVYVAGFVPQTVSELVTQTVPTTVQGTVPQTVTGDSRIEDSRIEGQITDNTTGASPVVWRAQAHATPPPVPPVDNFAEPPGLASPSVDNLPAEPPDKPPAIAEPVTPAPAKSAGKRPAHGSRLPDDWQLPKDWGDWAMGERPDLSAEDVRREASCFADYWHAKVGADARKADWQATWRNWIRRAHGSPRASPAYTPAHARASPHAYPPATNGAIPLVRSASASAFELARQKLFGEVIDATV